MNKLMRSFVLNLLFCVAALIGTTVHAEQRKLPDNLQWLTNDTDPIFADPAATRGGRFRMFMMSFPTTLRMVGPDANGGIAGPLRENTMSLVGQHPNTLNPIPALATHWAFGADGKSAYFKLDPDARWSDGVPITADDFVFSLEFMRSKYIVAPWYNNFYTETITDIVKFDDYTIGVFGGHARPPNELLFELSLGPIARHFHKLDEHWVDDYNWKIEPNTGPYQISEIRKGKYIEFKRKQDWWADKKRFFQYRFNPDYVRIKVIRDMNVAYQHFSKGELDTFGLVLPRLWYKKATGPIYDQGYVGRIKFYNDVPQSMQGLFLNEDDPLLHDRNVRLGIAYSMNFAKLIQTILRNDYDRLNTMNDGYGEFSNTKIQAREFSLEKAAKYFEAAGWKQRGPDGILVKNGQRLSVRITYGNPESTDRLVFLKQEAANAGLELTLQQLDGTAAFKQILEKKHQIAWMAWGSGGGAAPSYWESLHSDNAHKPQTNNISNVDNKVLDQKIDAYQASTDPKQRVQLAHDIEQLVYEQGSYIPGYKVPYTREAFWRWLKLPKSLGTKSSANLFDPFGGNVIADSFGSGGGLFWIDEAEKERVQKARILHEKFDPIMIIDETWRTPSAAQDSRSAQ